MLRLVRRGALAGQLPRYAALAPSTPRPPLGREAFATPAGFHPIEASTSLPAGSFDAACEAVLTMGMHREAGLLTAMAADRVREGDTVIVGVPVGPMALVVPCRVLWATDSGFGYATLPGHPEAGVEAFQVGAAADGGVSYRVFGYSRPAGVARLGGPVAKLAAARTIKTYLAAMRRLTA